MATIGAKLLVDTLPRYINGEICLKKQLSKNATYAGLINKRDGLLDFQKSAEELERQIRAYDPWPICYFSWNSKNVKVFNARVLKSHHLRSGQRGIIEKYPCIGTRTYDLQVVKLQMPGRQKISGIVFLNGARNWVDKNAEETKKIKPNIIPMIYGGAIVRNQDVIKRFYKETDTVGYFGGSVFDTIPLEGSMTEATESFKNMNRFFKQFIFIRAGDQKPGERRFFFAGKASSAKNGFSFANRAEKLFRKFNFFQAILANPFLFFAAFQAFDRK